MVMLYAGIALSLAGIILLLVTQIVLRRMMNQYKKNWGKKNEMQ